MPTTIAEVFAAAGLTQKGVVGWGTKPKASDPGVYVVSLARGLDTCDGQVTEAPLAAAEFQHWLKVRTELTLPRATNRTALDGSRSALLDSRRGHPLHRSCGIPVSERIGHYYKTPIGDRSPHRGGYFLKLLSNLDHLWVHYAECPDFKAAEDHMLRRFCQQVSDDSRRALKDPFHPSPFANLEWPAGTRKAHGLRGACEPKKKTSSSRS